MYIRPEKKQVILTQASVAWPRWHKKEHCSLSIRHPGVVAEEGKTFNCEESKPID